MHRLKGTVLSSSVEPGQRKEDLAPLLLMEEEL
jgi:hypothetical protein